MAYRAERLEELAVQQIRTHMIWSLRDLAHFLPCCRKTIFNLGLNKSERILKEILTAKVEIKRQLREDWFNSDNPTLRIALYKLLANPNELAALNGTSRKVNYAARKEPICRVVIVEDQEVQI